MNKDRKYCVEIITKDNFHEVEEVLNRDIEKYIDDDVYAVRFFCVNKDGTSSRSTPYYFNKDYCYDELSIKEKIDSDEKELKSIAKFKYLEKYVGEFARIHYAYKSKDRFIPDSMVGKVLKVNYFDNIIIMRDGYPVKIPFISEDVFIISINTCHEKIYWSDVSIDNEYKDNVINNYGKNVYIKRKKRK